MDPSIMKLLEEDEDETMHSGADVEAFTAALNRDIGGDVPVSQPSDSNATGILSQASSSTATNLSSEWPTSVAEENLPQKNQEEEKQHLKHEEQQPSQNPTRVEPGVENEHQHTASLPETDQLLSQQKQPPNDDQKQQLVPKQTQFVERPQGTVSDMRSSQSLEQERFLRSESQHQKLQQLNETAGAEHAMRRAKPGSGIPFQRMMPVLLSNLDKDRTMQLHQIFAKLKNNEVTKDDFLRVIRNIVGETMLRQAVQKVQSQLQAQAAQNSQANPQQHPSTSQASAQSLSMPSRSAPPLTEAQSFIQHSFPQAQQQKEISGLRPKGIDNQKEGSMIHANQATATSVNMINQGKDVSMMSLQEINRQQQHPHFSQSPVPMYGGHVPIFPRPSTGAAATASRPQIQDQQMRQTPVHQGMASNQMGASPSMNIISAPMYELQNSISDPLRLHSGSFSHASNKTVLTQSSNAWQQSVNKEYKSSSISSTINVKQEPTEKTYDQQNKPRFPAHQASPSFGANPVNVASGSLKDEPIDIQSSRIGFSPSASLTTANPISGSLVSQADPTSQMRPPVSSAAPVNGGVNLRTPPKKPSIGQKKPLETLGTPSPQPSKKQKVSGDLLEQSIEQLNDVTAVSGVNLREEEEQLLSTHKEESRASEATRRVVQEEEEKLILQKEPLQKKIAEIMSKCGLKSVSNDVERCLSMRVDVEKARHRISITSDVQRQIMMMNREAKEIWDKKQAEEAEKLRKQNDTDGSAGVDAEKEKDETRVKALKVNKEEDDKMRTTAANVAARVAVGGDDMLSKWQLMAEQARQKHEGGMAGPSASQPSKDVTRRSMSSLKAMRDNQTEKRGLNTSTSAGRRLGRNLSPMPLSKVTRTISIKDVIAVLEKEPQMAKSPLLYRLYERQSTTSPSE
ncbi:hypothetical protein QJS10_CPB13g00420 [Acorus calamus]|uniref:RST domain-containing protein n=1 Tax=Acorus calamus TaxID=4465 RepID=A0AAV9DJR3_ACOCL|nr:hypothetical protein QJS10_CPB13g00420 [Acorus calamus]